MGLVQDIKYETLIGRGKSEKINVENVLKMLKELRNDVGSLQSSFANKNLREVLEVIEKGSYIVEGAITTRVDLREPRAVIEIYKRLSEGGCRSCINLGEEVIDAQDATIGWYCEVSDPDYNKDARGDECGCRYSGSSPKVRKYQNNPCGDWKPKFVKTLDEILKEEESLEDLKRNC
ncbi:MAG: hypothetical protein Q8L29_00320 [archaeon]|nr:hypothetical protein [archaeon]